MRYSAVLLAFFSGVCAAEAQTVHYYDNAYRPLGTSTRSGNVTHYYGPGFQSLGTAVETPSPQNSYQAPNPYGETTSNPYGD